MLQYELNLRDYLRIFHKRKVLIVVVFLSVLIVSILYLSRQPVLYKATATVKIEERKTIAGLLTEWIAYTPADIMESQAKNITGYPIMKKVALRLGLIDETSSEVDIEQVVSGIQGSIETQTVGRTNIISITVTSSNPRKAMILANAVADVYVEDNLLEKTKQSRHTRQFIEEQLFALEARLKEAEEHLKIFGDGVTNIKLAEPIQNRLLELEFQLGELLQKYTQKHPRVIQIREQIRKMEEQVKGFSGQELEYARLSREVEVNKKLYGMLKEKLEEARISEAEKIADVSKVDPAGMPSAPISTNKNIGILIGSVMGLILGVALAFVRETLDTSIGTIEDVESVMKLPVLGVVPSIMDSAEARKRRFVIPIFNKKISFGPVIKRNEVEERFVRLVAHSKPKSPAAESFRNIRTNLKLDPTKKTILITSSSPREGKTTVIINLALVMAQSGARTLLVSTDLRRPALAKTFGIDREPGLTEVLNETASLDQVLRSSTDIMLGEIQLDELVGKPSGIDNLCILTCGGLPYNPAEVLESKALADLMEELKRRFDIILFDSPPVLPVTDASLLASRLDCVVLVYEIGRTGRDALLRSKIQIESVGGKIAGIVLNHTRPQTEAISSYPYYYHYKYKYYGKEEAEKET